MTMPSCSAADFFRQDRTDHAGVAEEVTWGLGVLGPYGTRGKLVIHRRKWGQIMNIREANVAMSNPLKTEVSMVKFGKNI